MLPETIRAMEKAFCDGVTRDSMIDRERTKSFFESREPFSDGMVVVNKFTQMPDGSLLPQRILVAETTSGWRVVKHLPGLPDAVD
jgi:hypothetical protein